MTGIFKAAVMQVKYAKIGFFGGTGSGKTTIATKIAIALSILFFGRAPVAFVDTEKGSDFVQPLFDKEKVPLIVAKTRSFADLKQGIADAIAAGACCIIIDSMTHFWVELVRAFCSRNKIVKPEFHHWKQIKDEWAEFTTSFINSPIHIICCGRAGSEYDYQEDAQGKKELVKGDSKMKAEGEFGYETDLLIELYATAAQVDGSAKRKPGKSKAAPSIVTHFAIVKKSRVWSLNGKVFQFQDQDIYKPGDYKPEYEAFSPFFDFLKLSTSHVGVDTTRNSEALFNGNGQSEYYERKRRRDVAAEEIKGALTAVWGAATGKDAQAKGEVLNVIFETRSWTSVEGMKMETLEWGARVCKKLVALARNAKDLDKLENLIEVIKQAKAEIADEDADPLLNAVEEGKARAAATPAGDSNFFATGTGVPQ
jgi:hypothetical protein